MNRNYKVIWNRSLGCFTAVAEYAKSRGKSSNTAVTSGVSSSRAVATVNTRLLRLSAICLGLAASGIGVQSIAAVNYQGDIGDNINALGTLNVNGGVSDPTELTTNNIGVISNSNPANNVFGVKTLTIKLAKNINLSADGSVKTGSTVMDDEGVTITGGAKFTKSGIDAGTQKISGVLNGAVDASSTEAVNGRQLNATNQALAAQKIKYFSVKSTGGGNENNNGAIGADAIAIGKNASATGLRAVSLGVGAAATGKDATAIGPQAQALSDRSIALGDLAGVQSSASGNSSNIAIGGSGDKSATGFGAGSKVVGRDNIALGAESGSDIAGKINVGIGAEAGNFVKGDINLGLGLKAGSQVEGSRNAAVGSQAGRSVTGNFNSAFGNLAGQTVTGDSNSATGDGSGNGVTGSQNVALGFEAGQNITADGTISIGSLSKASANNAIAIGKDASAIGLRAVSLGIGATATGEDATAIGPQAQALSDRSIALGNLSGAQSSAPNNRSNIAIGGNGDSTVNGFGAGSQVVGRDNIALGTESASIVRGRSNIGIGSETGNNLDGSFNSSLGFRAGSTVDGDQNVAMGFEAGQKVTANRTVSIGARSKASADDAIAIGTNAKASGSSSISIGNNVNIAKGLDGAVGIGNNSTVAASTVASFVPTGATTVVGISTGSNVVSVGSAGNERRLTNVAAGGADTDAVNVSQLRAVDNQVSTNTSDIGKGIKFNVNNSLNKTFALGEEIKFNTDPNLTTTALGSNDGITLGLANTISVGAPTDNPITINGSAGTISGLTNQSFDPSNFTSGQAATEDQLKSVSDVANAGWGITVGQNGGTTFNGGTTNIGPGDRVAIDSGKNINFLVDSTEGVPTLTVSTKDEVEFTQVTIGDTSGDNTVLTSGANGLDVGGDKLTNVGSGTIGTGSTDAINGSQLFDTNQNVDGNTTVLGGSYDADTDIYTPPSYVLDDGTNNGTNASPYNDVGSALGNLDGRTISNTANIAKGINFNVNNTLKKTFALGEEIKFNTDANLTTTALGSNDGITLGLADTINVGSSPAAVTIDGTAGTVSNLSNTTFDADATYTGGVAATQEQLSALSGSVTTLGFGIQAADGATVKKNLGEAVEIIGADSNIDTQVNGGKVEVKLSNTLDLGNGGSVTTGNTLLNDSGVTLKGGGNQVVRLTNNGLDNGNNKISNVAAGDIAAGSTEAVNGGQLYNAANALTTVMGGNAVNNGGVITTSNIGDTGKNNIHDAIKSVNTAAVQAKTTVEQGKNITVTPSTNTDGSTKYTVATADTLDVTSVKAGDTLLNTSGVSIDDGNGNSSALSAAGSTVTNAAGSTSYGASGLTASDNAGNSTVVNQDGLSFTDSDGMTGPSVTASGIDAGSIQITNVASGGEVGTNAANINDVRAAAASSKTVLVGGTNVAPVVKTLSADGQDTYLINVDGASASAGSTALTVTAGLKDDNNVTNYAVDLSQDSKDSLVRADSAMQSIVTQIDGNDVKTVTQSSNTANFVTGDNIVLSDDNGSIKVATSDNLKVTSVMANTITTGNTTVNNNGLSITNGPSITADQGINAGGQTVTGVADGIAPKDAVNVSQLRAVESNFGSAFNELGYRIDDVEKESRAGIAATLALESAPYVPGKFTYAVGAGFHRGENAVGASLRHTADSGRWSLTGGVAADSEGGASVRVGVSGVIN